MLVKAAIADGVATLTLARADARNSLDHDMARDWCDRLREVSERADVGVILVRADGPAWCVGGAIDAMAEAGDDAHDWVVEIGEWINPLVETLHECPQVTIAAVHGAVAGGGLGILLAHDLVIASRGTQFALGYARLGTSPDAGSSFFLARDIGYRRALELYLTNERVDVDRALELGMVNRAVPPEELDGQSAELARRIAAGSRNAQASTKRLLREASDGLLRRHLDDEIHTFADNAREPDFAEGVRAFIEKRAPVFGTEPKRRAAPG